MSKKRKRTKPFRRGQLLSGGAASEVAAEAVSKELSGAGMGETMHDPARYYKTEPTAEQLQMLPPRAGPPPPGTPKFPAAPRRVIDEEDMPIIRTIPPVASMLRITSHLINNVRKRRVDIGLSKRVDVVLWNVSNNLIWWDSSGNPSPPLVAGGQGSGAPLPGNATPNGYDGASIGINAGPEVQIWAIGTIAGNQMIVVFETSR